MGVALTKQGRGFPMVDYKINNTDPDPAAR